MSKSIHEIIVERAKIEWEKATKNIEEKLRQQLIDLGWTPPASAPECTSPPLYARVAKHLGMIIAKQKYGNEWLFKTGAVGMGEWQNIPRYDLDVRLAMDALEEYRDRQNKKNPVYDAGITIKRKSRLEGNKWVVSIERPASSSDAFKFSLPEAICLAIDKHASNK